MPFWDAGEREGEGDGRGVGGGELLLSFGIFPPLETRVWGGVIRDAYREPATPLLKEDPTWLWCPDDPDQKA